MGKQRYQDIRHGSSLYHAGRERQENYIGKKIAEARKAQHLSLMGLSTRLEEYGISIGRQGLGKWETGDAVPNGYQLLAVCHALHIDDAVDYFTHHPKKEALLDDSGLKKLRDYRDDLIASGRYTPTSPDNITYIHMPVSILPASAGTGAFLEEECFESMAFPETQIPAGADFGVQVRGDSMEPCYHDGQTVWVQRCTTLSPGQVGLFLYDGEGYIKRYDERLPDISERDNYLDSNGVLQMQPVLVSYNPAYPPKVVSPALSFQIVGRILPERS